MPDYTAPAIPVDRGAIADETYDRMAELNPGFNPDDPAGTETYLVEPFSELIGEVGERATEHMAGIYKQLAWLFRIFPIGATFATAPSTWTFTTDDEFLIEAGTPLSFPGADGQRVGFLVAQDYLKPAGSFSTGIGEILLVAETAGAAGTGLQDGVRLERALATLETIVVETSTVGGEDAETDTEYLNRVTDRFANRTEVLVRPVNFEADARLSVPQVARALAINGYDADTDTEDVGGHISVAVVDANGADPGSTIRTDGAAAQQAKSVSGLTVHWIPATYTPVEIVFSGVPEEGFDAADVEARAIDAVELAISPAEHGLPRSGDQPLWIDDPIVRRQDISTVLNNVEGFEHYHEAAAGSATTVSGSPNLTVVTPTTGWHDGMLITGPGIPAGTRILSGAGTSTMVLSANATASASGVDVTASGLALNGSLTDDVTLAGPAGLPASLAGGSSVTGTVA